MIIFGIESHWWLCYKYSGCCKLCRCDKGSFISKQCCIVNWYTATIYGNKESDRSSKKIKGYNELVSFL